MTTPKQLLRSAIQLSGFQNWRPSVDVPQLNRPLSRPSELSGDGRIAAVMILVFADSAHSSSDNDSNQLLNCKLILTKRNANLSKHASQISFPGGRQDPGETLEKTALRETHEEVGVEVGNVEVLGQLNPVYIPPSDFTVTPFVGWHDSRPDFVRCQAEVEEIIEAPIRHMLDPATLVFGDIIHADEQVHNVPYYQVGDHQVWGATAIMIGEFVERLTRSGLTLG